MSCYLHMRQCIGVSRHYLRTGIQRFRSILHKGAIMSNSNFEVNKPNSAKLGVSSFSLVFGAGLVLTGVLMGLNTLGLVQVSMGEIISTWWPSALAVWALMRMLVREGSFIGNVIIWVVGVSLQLSKLGVIDGVWNLLIPLLFIGIGLTVFFGGFRKRAAVKVSDNWPGFGHMRDESTDVDVVRSTAIMGGTEIRCTSQTFKGGELTCILGGLEVDLRNAEIDGSQASITITCIMGGIEMRVPPHWKIVVHGTPILGGIEDKTFANRNPTAEGPTLVLVATTIMAGVEVK